MMGGLCHGCQEWEAGGLFGLPVGECGGGGGVGSLATTWRPVESGGWRGSRTGAICGTDGVCDGARK